MKCREVMEFLRELAPEATAQSWDNVGLLVGREDKDVLKVMTALDATEGVIDQAIAWGADLLVTHHPMIFSPVKRVVWEELVGHKIIKLIRADISYFAMHTNCDACVMAEEAADKIGLTETVMLEESPAAGPEGAPCGIGRAGILAREMTLRELCELVKEAFAIDTVRLIGDPEQRVTRAALSTGSGKSMVKFAKRAGSEVLISGDLDHHCVIDALDEGLALIDAGHYGTERFVAYTLANALASLELEVKVAQEKSPYQYI
ncbi:MAG: Nif3-like dinuclear metal center hexameric protein [Lachnospiraceae bacterium]|nr:Nif3-like dinuclear metal center hexameric protein [Lachnospiraceae bacterium]